MNRLRTTITGVGLVLLAAACGAEDSPGTDNENVGPGGTSTSPEQTGSMSNGPAPNTPAPNTPAPNTPAPNTPAPNTPAPNTPAPNTPAPNTPGPVDTGTTPPGPAPTDPGPVGTEPVPAPTDTPTAPTDTTAPTETAPVEPVPNPEPPVEEPTLITSGEGAYWQVGTAMEVATGTANVTVNADQAQQNWYGFGGTFNEKGWNYLLLLSESDRALALQLLFSKTDGLGFTMGRIPVGSSDYGMNRYSLDDTAMETDYGMADFTIERDQELLIPYIKAALEVNPDLWLWGSPWSPPPWMKDNKAFDRGNLIDDNQTLAAHALYLARFVEDYAQEGIDVKAVHPQNEPGYAQDYPSCGWTGSQMARYIGDFLGPLFEERALTTEIWLGTMSNPTVDKEIADAVIANPTAMQYVKGIGLQWGMDQHAAGFTQTGLHVMQTEHKCGNYPWETATYKSDKAPNDHAYAIESWGFFKTWLSAGVNSYMAWNMVLDTIGRSLDEVRPWNQNALLAVDEAAGTLIVTPYYYVFRHLAQYVDPGAVRVATQGGDALAFRNPDNSIVAVIHNSGGAAAPTVVSMGGRLVQVEVPARGWATVNLQAQ